MMKRPASSPGLGGEQLLDGLGAQQRHRRGVGVDELALLVVHGHRLGEHAEDALEPLARAPQLGDQLGVGEPARGPLGQRLQERELLVGRRARRREAEAEAAEQLVGDLQRQVDPVREVHGDQPFRLVVVVGDRAQGVGVDRDHPRLAGAQRRDRELDLLGRRPPGREVRGELRSAGALVVRGQPLRLAGLVDDVQRARVGDARHDQRDELVGALAGPARAVGDPLDLEQELEAVVALADPERGAGDAGRVEREPHLGAQA